MKEGLLVWRIGYIHSPLELTPWERLKWMHRFDDPDKTFRTLYGAEQRKTAFREVLADLRPNTAMRMDFEKRFGRKGVWPVTTIS